LLVLQTYKSTGASDKGKKFYDEYSEVSDFFLKVREIVIKKKKPRRMDLNNNLVRYSETCIEPCSYPETFEGVILSYADRFTFNKKLYNQVRGVWDQHKDQLKV
jgi:dipeptidyl-peptidase-3